MQRQSKWFAVPSLEKSTALVARRCLADRLRWMWRMLCEAALDGLKNQAAVHQLRVATRRSATVLDVLHEALTATSELPWLEKQLKHLRRAAAAARDYDVLASAYKRTADETVAEGATPALLVAAEPPRKLRQELESRRTAARGPIRKLAEKLRRKEFPRHVNHMLAEMRKAERQDQRSPTEFGVFARQAFREAWRAYRTAAESEPQTIEELHALRIRTKALRYTSELLASAFTADFREQLYPRIVDLQEHLGTLNDHAVALRYLGLMQSELRGKKTQAWLGTEISRRQAALIDSQRDFLKWWNDERAAFLGIGERLLAAESTPTASPSESRESGGLAMPAVAEEPLGQAAHPIAGLPLAAPPNHVNGSGVADETHGGELLAENSVSQFFVTPPAEAPVPGNIQ